MLQLIQCPLQQLEVAEQEGVQVGAQEVVQEEEVEEVGDVQILKS